MDPIIFEFLKKIYLYYPIGIPQIYTKYPGYKLLRDILDEKLLQIQKQENTPWSSLIAKLSAKFKRDLISDNSYIQFPSYDLSIDLENVNESRFELKRTLNTKISLLTDHYTIFIKDVYLFRELKEYKGKPVPENELLYNKANLNSKFNDAINDLKALVKQEFPNKEFVHHRLLFDYKIVGGTVYGFMDEFNPVNAFPIYHYLFSNDLYYSNFTVLD